MTMEWVRFLNQGQSLRFFSWGPLDQWEATILSSRPIGSLDFDSFILWAQFQSQPSCPHPVIPPSFCHSKVIPSFISHSVILKSFCHSKVIPSFFWILTHPIIPLSFLSMWAWSLATHPPLQRGVGGQTHICINIIIFTYGSLATHPPLQRGVGSQTSRSF